MFDIIIDRFDNLIKSHCKYFIFFPNLPRKEMKDAFRCSLHYNNCLFVGRYDECLDFKMYKHVSYPLGYIVRGLSLMDFTNIGIML